MMARSAIAAATLLVAASTGQPAHAQADPNHVYGDDPGWTKFRELAEAGVLARLIDPESARITWLSGYRKGGIKPILSKRIFGYIACGTVNARNRMGGYTGATTFVAVVDYGAALFVDLDTKPRGMYGESCRQQVAEGKFPPFPQSVGNTSSAGDPAGVATSVMLPSGLSVRAMPEGAYVTEVEPKSAAAAAGLSAGMVIASINGIPLAGMGDAMTKVAAAAGANATLTFVGGKSLTLGDVIGKAPSKP